MLIGKKIDFSRLFLYLLLAVASLFLYHIGDNGEPFSLALSYAIIGGGLSPIAACFINVLPSLLSLNLTLITLYIGQALLVALGYLIQKQIHHTDKIKTGIFSMLTLSVALGLFVAFAPFYTYVLPFNGLLTLNASTQKVIFAALIFLLAHIFYVAFQAIFYKFLKCRLRNDELVFCVLFFTLIGIGICRFLSVNAYMGIAFFILLLFSCITKDATSFLCAFCLSLPPLFTVNLSPERFFLYGAAITLFIKSGRLAAVCALLSIFFGYGYFDGLYAYPTELLIQSLLSVMLPSLFFILIPAPLIHELENKIVFYREKHLSRIAINRNRAAIGEKLFEISSVFREIETAFTTLNADEAETKAKEYMRTQIIDDCCKNCPAYANCKTKNIETGLGNLIDVGCIKGKASLIDIPRGLSNVCVNQNSLLHATNRQIADYKNYMLETENAASGRALLAGQAQGISEILKNLALEQSEPLRIYTDKERAISISLLSAGIICNEVLIYGDEDNLTLSLISYGRADVKRIAAVATQFFGMPMLISERIALSNDKFCCILRKKPYFDAAFGVASTKKNGELASGDTHSVIKIDERKFMVALSDGMGSGEYAHKVSESTISLLESFYRAKMPSTLILSAVNRLMTFSKEESFACVDIAVVDLDNGSADVVKIGSPIGFILSANTVKVLDSSSLPLGILDSLRPDVSSYTLAENDVLVFVSDGISDAFGSTADLYEVLRTVPVNNPQQLADTLLAQALTAYGGVAKDDMTVVAVRLFRNLSAA